MIRHRLWCEVLVGLLVLPLVACSGSGLGGSGGRGGGAGAGGRGASGGVQGTGGAHATGGSEETGGNIGTGGRAGEGGAAGGGGARDAGMLSDAAHDTSNGDCWSQSDCGGGQQCASPGQKRVVCSGTCHMGQECEHDSSCRSDGAVPLICQDDPCSCPSVGLPTCIPGCSSDADCAAGNVCNNIHRCDNPVCGPGGACPVDFTCNSGFCARNACVSDSECSNACVKGLCYDRPGQCQSS